MSKQQWKRAQRTNCVGARTSVDDRVFKLMAVCDDVFSSNRCVVFSHEATNGLEKFRRSNGKQLTKRNCSSNGELRHFLGGFVTFHVPRNESELRKRVHGVAYGLGLEVLWNSNLKFVYHGHFLWGCSFTFGGCAGISGTQANEKGPGKCRAHEKCLEDLNAV